VAEDGVQLERVRTELAKARQRIAALEAADRERESVARALRERVKELNCLYGISHLLEEPDISLRELLQGTADLLPLAWQYPEITAARIVRDGEQYSTENYREDADCCQVAAVKVHGRQSGIVQVCYLQERPEGDEGPFLQEERSLIDAVAERLGRITERKRMEQALAESEREHRTLFETMAQGVVYQDAEGQIIDANPAAQRILGLTLDQMQGRTSTDPRWRAIHPDGSAFAGDTHPSMVALQTGRQVRNVVMGVYSPRNEAYTWININACRTCNKRRTGHKSTWTSQG
jgi:PAS domain-containing protein